MSDHDFERRLERMFAQPPRVSDSEAFTRRVEAKLERGWGVRRVLVGCAGALGGVIAASQLINAEFVRRVESVSLPAQALALPKLPTELQGAGLESAAMSAEVIWMAAAMLGLAFAFAATRWAEGF